MKSILLEILLCLAVLAFLIVFPFIGCEQRIRPAYTLSCEEVTCLNNTGGWKNTSSRYVSKVCYWNCADYEGEERVYVNLMFEKKDNCWQLSAKYIGNGLCNLPEKEADTNTD